MKKLVGWSADDAREQPPSSPSPFPPFHPPLMKKPPRARRRPSAAGIRTPDRLRTSTAYDICYRKLYNAFPECRCPGCLDAPRKRAEEETYRRWRANMDARVNPPVAFEFPPLPPPAGPVRIFGEYVAWIASFPKGAQVAVVAQLQRNAGYNAEALGRLVNQYQYFFIDEKLVEGEDILEIDDPEQCDISVVVDKIVIETDSPSIMHDPKFVAYLQEEWKKVCKLQGLEFAKAVQEAVVPLKSDDEGYGDWDKVNYEDIFQKNHVRTEDYFLPRTFLERRIGDALNDAHMMGASRLVCLNVAPADQVGNTHLKEKVTLETVSKPGTLPWIVELGTKLWGTAVVNGREYRFGADQSKVIDPIKGMWFDFATNRGGGLKDLMKKVDVANRGQTDDVVVVCAADVPMRSLDWIWEGHLLRGSQELMSGLPDLSKSTVQCNYVACATAGLLWPDGAPAIEPINVIMMTAEDTLDQIVVPRLRAAGADLNRVNFLTCIKTDEHDRQFFLGEDLDRLEHLVKKIGHVGLVCIDPITAYMGGQMESHRATEVRSQLGPLKDFAERMNIAISTITHPPKTAGSRALDHFIGSQAFIAACRVGHLCVTEMQENEDGEPIPTGRILFTNVRNTAYRRKMPTLAYRKEEVVVERIGQGFDMREITAPKIIWEGSVDITAEGAVAAASGNKKTDQQPKVQAFLRDLLKDGKQVPQKEVEEAATARGFTDKQLRIAKEKLGVQAIKEKGDMKGGWLWCLPSASPPDGGTRRKGVRF
jgi:putative DNA primase/helicase